MINKGVHRPTGPPAHPLLAPARRGSGYPVGRWAGGPLPRHARPNHMLVSKIRFDGHMAAVKGRRHRTGVADAVLLQVRVSPHLRQDVEAAATALGISLSAYMEALLAREAEQRDETGRPLWWTDPVPRDQQELPLTKSA